MIDKAESLVIEGIEIDSALDPEMLEGMFVFTTEDDETEPAAGTLQNAREDGEDLLADIRVDPEHELAAYILERWQRHPEGMGVQTHRYGRVTDAIFYNKQRERSV